MTRETIKLKETWNLQGQVEENWEYVLSLQGMSVAYWGLPGCLAVSKHICVRCIESGSSHLMHATNRRSKAQTGYVFGKKSSGPSPDRSGKDEQP